MYAEAPGTGSQRTVVCRSLNTVLSVGETSTGANKVGDVSAGISEVRDRWGVSAAAVVTSDLVFTGLGRFPRGKGFALAESKPP
jgi:hypothetical protein